MHRSSYDPADPEPVIQLYVQKRNWVGGYKTIRRYLCIWIGRGQIGKVDGGD